MAFQDRRAVKLPVCLPIGDGSEVTPIDLTLLPWEGFKPDEGFFLFEVASKGVQIVLEDGDASVKAQWGDPLKDHSGGGLCVDLKNPVNVFFEGIQLARPCYGGLLGSGSARNFLTVFGSIWRVAAIFCFFENPSW